jgi:hypothetical protein
MHFGLLHSDAGSQLDDDERGDAAAPTHSTNASVSDNEGGAEGDEDVLEELGGVLLSEADA